MLSATCISSREHVIIRIWFQHHSPRDHASNGNNSTNYTRQGSSYWQAELQDADAEKTNPAETSGGPGHQLNRSIEAGRRSNQPRAPNRLNAGPSFCRYLSLSRQTRTEVGQTLDSGSGQSYRAAGPSRNNVNVIVNKFQTVCRAPSYAPLYLDSPR